MLPALLLGIENFMPSELPPLLPPLRTCTVAVIGLGYVGLPLAVEFAKPQNCLRTGHLLRRKVIGYDVNMQRLSELNNGHDRTREVSEDELNSASGLHLTSNPECLAEADVFIVTVPTPIDSVKVPDLSSLRTASATVGQALKARSRQRRNSVPVVIYESTVYPGATEEVCAPILEFESGLKLNNGFLCGYSPERINPGDQDHRLKTIVKVTSGSTQVVADWIDAFYGSIIEAGTHQAPMIKVAEAAKVIENTQRDLNIALVNELAIIFSKIGIDTLDVLKAAASKWNFLPFSPGLVGGHCIGVDPYYLTYKAEQLGYHPQVVLAGRRINDGMGEWVAQQLVLEMARRRLVIGGARVLVLGLSFKENCPDLRNTRVVPLLSELRCYGMETVVVDPVVDIDAARVDYGLEVLTEIPVVGSWQAVIAAVAHHQFSCMQPSEWQSLIRPQTVVYDLKGFVPRQLATLRL